MSDKLDGILFDYGGTLAGSGRDSETFRTRLLEYNVTVSPAEALHLERELTGYWRLRYSPEPRGQRWSRSIRTQCIRHALSCLGRPLELDSLSEGLAEGWDEFEDLRLHADVLPCLEWLSAAGYKLAVVSQNLQTSVQLSAKMEAIGILTYFSAVVTSESAGFDKPDRRLFLEASSQLGEQPNRLCHVGDVYELDVLGSRDAGIMPLLLDRRGNSNHDDVLTLASLSQLPRLLSTGQI